MFKKVLIANRGAIACRIIRTLRKMGVASVAVYSDADVSSLHVREADEAVKIGAAPAQESYLRADRILEVARATGAQAIHPGYGFLSENAEFAQSCQDAGLVFIGPQPAQMRAFGLKHLARELAAQNAVPLLPGSSLLTDVGHAHAEARRIGYPVMLKSTGGGGGIGMRLAWSEDELTEAYGAVDRLAKANFKESGMFLEKFIAQARHIEVQIFGDGKGNVLALGERDCSAQRRNQKVIEETPAPALNSATRKRLLETASRLCRAVGYESAGTVEFVFDQDSSEFYFLEVNTRLQVEHGVTEAVTGIDLVEWMVKQAAGELDLSGFVPNAKGAAVQVRIYAEDAAKNFQPAPGVLTEVQWPKDARIETWVERGVDVPPYYDPMVAKIIVRADSRSQAVKQMQRSLANTRLAGTETNLSYLRQVIADDVFRSGSMTTRTLTGFVYRPYRVDVIEPGVQTTIQDWPGRVGYWDIGVPPSGPMDSLALRLVNRLLNNHENAAALECTASGPTLRFSADAVIAICGADMRPTLDGHAIEMWRTHGVRAGSVLKLGSVNGAGLRTYVGVQGGFDVPQYLGSHSTFTLGQFGGHAGRTLRTGDVLPLRVSSKPLATDIKMPNQLIPLYTDDWEIGVLYGPHGAPDFFTEEDIATFFATDWEVHYNSSRTGVRLIGPKPHWARTDGGEAGLHPSNIHDNAYAVGAIDFTGDMPVILGPDGPSLGGFVCPAVIAATELWKLGQLRPGNRVRFVRVNQSWAVAHEHAASVAIKTMRTPRRPRNDSSVNLRTVGLMDTRGNDRMRQRASGYVREGAEPILRRIAATQHAEAVSYRQSGDEWLLIEYGDLRLDLNLRFRVHALMQWLQRECIAGVLDLTPGIRSLQVHFDNRKLSIDRLLDILGAAERELPAVEDMVVPTRTVHLPLSWDDPATRLAIEKYTQSVRKDAPWCPSNIEFIRRINGLESIDDVKRIVFDASYLVLGLGDVYLGAPVATPVDPRHRLVTTKYNPARTWTPENAVGIGGAYLCVYGMEGPGGYQFVGRTLQMWNRYRQTQDFADGKPWLLRFFDQIRFFPVSADELMSLREDFPLGRYKLRIEESEFRLGDYNRFLKEHGESIANFKQNQQAAFDAERERWRQSGQAEYATDVTIAESSPSIELDLPQNGRAVATHVAGNVWKIPVNVGDSVAAGEPLVIVESMKMEINVNAPCDGKVMRLFCKEGTQVSAGQELVVIEAM